MKGATFQYHDHHHRPPTPRPVAADAPRLSYGTIDVLPLRRPTPLDGGCYCFPNGFTGVCRCVVFLVIQGVVAWVVGFGLLVALLLCVVLVPLCGVGLVLFRLLFRSRLIECLAKWDAALVNFAAPDDAQIQVDPSRAVLPLATPGGDSDLPIERLVAGLDTVSAESAMVLGYFTTIKLVLATVGLCLTNVVVGLPLLLFHALLSHTHALVADSFTTWQTVCAYAALTLVVVVAAMSLDLVVALCATATRFFCCERVYTLALPRTRAATMPRPNVVVIRLPPSATGVYGFATATSSASVAAASRGSS